MTPRKPDEGTIRVSRPTPTGSTSIGDVRHDVSLLGPMDLHLFNEGTHDRIYERLGAHLHMADGVAGTYFAVWAPNARSVSVMGDFNGWSRDRHGLRTHGDAGIWEGFVPGVVRGARYKYHVIGPDGRYAVDKSDPYGLRHEIAPETASVVWDLDYEWGDDAWMRARAGRQSTTSPMSIYEVHLGSWMRVPADGYRSLSYREVAPKLAKYVAEQGFTHVELLPVMEHPFFGSWGYQVTGYYAPSSRFGTPQDFMFLVDTLHQHDIGVILDWVPSHFPTDAHGLSYFDGTHLYEHEDPRLGHQPDWNSYIFNYDRHEVRSFLRSNALFWLDAFHVDGLRVDAVASMLYLDYSRRDGEWIPNRFGGRENLGAIAFLRGLNEAVYRDFPDTATIAEESTSWPMVSRPVYVGGLGFGMKWDMGWMHDSLDYFARDPAYRKFHHNDVTFRMMYAWSENFVLPLSHDEVVHGKGSLLGRMPGDDWQRRANLRLLMAWMYGQPGKKLLFMGGEFGQWREWNHDGSLDWELLEQPGHAGLQRWVRDLNRLYREEPALYEGDCEPGGFEWIDCHDADQSLVSFLRTGTSTDTQVLVVCNFTPVPRSQYRVGAPLGGRWEEVLNSDAEVYGGSGWGNFGGVEASEHGEQGRPFSLVLTVPPLGAMILKSTAVP